MATIEIYTTPICPYCVKAKHLLKRKGLEWEEIDVSQNPAIREEMIAKAGGQRTVPQIFINGHHVGGCDDLYALESQGELDKIL